MITRDKEILKKSFSDDSFGEALKLAMLEYFPEVKAIDIHVGVGYIRDEVLGNKLKEVERVIR